MILATRPTLKRGPAPRKGSEGRCLMQTYPAAAPLSGRRADDE